jgi:AmmeMemoRadiSam system protein B
MSSIRPTAVAGRFYPGSEGECQRMAREFFSGITPVPGIGGVVPHAGWVFSGSTAALAIAGVAATNPQTVVIFGAVHGPDPNQASVYSRGAWDTPLGTLAIDEELAARFAKSRPVVDDPARHRCEHSIEVQLPLLKYVLPDVLIVPVGVRPSPDAADVGRTCARESATSGRRVAFLGSTDLTHYGPAFGFEPHGRGIDGIRWAKEVNDRRLVALLQAMDANAVVSEVAVHRNACGPGAVAALIAAMVEMHAAGYVELRHTCSAECEGAGGPDRYNSVGYEAGVFTARCG